MTNYPRALYQPPAGRPRWANDRFPAGELQYLSWGWRSYGRHPIPVSRHMGWTYQLVVGGSAVLNIADKAHLLRNGSLAIIGPSCPNGWSGFSKTGRCRIFNWIWREPPLFESLRPGPEGFNILHTTGEVVRRIEMLHEETRNEIRFSDEESEHSLHALRIRLDVLMGRMCRRTERNSTSKAKVKYALTWLKKHPEELRPVAALSDYMQVSPATLNRLFRGELGQNVREAAYAVRMKAARQILERNTLPVKEVASKLGYAHANDFTRAYSRYWMRTPTFQWCDRSRSPGQRREQAARRLSESGIFS